MNWYFCEYHKTVHPLRQGDMGKDCLLVGPYTTKQEALDFSARVIERRSRRRGQYDVRRALEEF